MEERTSGVILRTRPLTETSLIVQWLTVDFGRVSTVAKGARRQKSPFAGKLDLFYLADLSFLQSRRSELHTLREVTVRTYHEPLRTELTLLERAAYFVQLIEQTTEPNTPLPGLFDLLVGALAALPMAPVQPLAVFAFEIKLLDQLGLRPDPGQINISTGARQLFQSLGELDWPGLDKLVAPPAHVDDLDQFLRNFINYHFGRVAKGRLAAVGH